MSFRGALPRDQQLRALFQSVDDRLTMLENRRYPAAVGANRQGLYVPVDASADLPIIVTEAAKAVSVGVTAVDLVNGGLVGGTLPYPAALGAVAAYVRLSIAPIGVVGVGGQGILRVFDRDKASLGYVSAGGAVTQVQSVAVLASVLVALTPAATFEYTMTLTGAMTVNYTMHLVGLLY